MKIEEALKEMREDKKKGRKTYKVTFNRNKMKEFEIQAGSDLNNDLTLIDMWYDYCYSKKISPNTINHIEEYEEITNK